MIKTLAIDLLRGIFLLEENALPAYAQLAHDVLAGKTINTGLFGQLQLPDVPDHIALIVMNGVMTKSDICGGEGTRTLANKVSASMADPSIKGIIILSENCPGGQADGVETFANAIAAANTRKPVVGAVSGKACSGAVWALTACEEIYATSNTDIIGCIGAMAQLNNPKKNDQENSDTIDVVSTKSPDKNAEFNNPELFRTLQLDPLCEIFHNSVKQGRGERLKLDKENVLSGKTYIAGAAKEYGLIDGIMSFNRVIARTNFLINKRSKNVS